MPSAKTDWRGEGIIMMLDVPINFLLRLGGEENRLIATALGAGQYYYYGGVVQRGGLGTNSNAWDALSALATTAMSVLYFRERLDRVEWAATGLMLGGLGLLAYHDAYLTR